MTVSKNVSTKYALIWGKLHVHKQVHVV